MGEDTELKAMSQIFDALSGLDADAQLRIIKWVTEKFGLVVPRSVVAGKERDSARQPTDISSSNADIQFRDFADLFDAARPATDVEKALVAGYWEQFGKGNSDFASQSVNDELKQLGHPVGNITRALSGLIDVRPALVQQLRKDGGTKQARKTYRLTAAGQRKVDQMCAAADVEPTER